MIPATAPLITGRRAIVYVKQPDDEGNLFAGREVKLGVKADDVYVVLEGLKEGEEIVSQGAFKVDSAMQIESKPSMMSAPSAAAPPAAKQEIRTPTPQNPVRGYKSSRAWLDKSLPAYRDAQIALAQDDLVAFRAAAGRGLASIAGAPPAAPESLQILAGERSKLARMEIEGARALFEDWSGLLIEAAAGGGLTADSQEWVVAFCPMAFSNRGAEWIQQGSQINNPYFGASMLRCGEVRRDLFTETR